MRKCEIECAAWADCRLRVTKHFNDLHVTSEAEEIIRNVSYLDSLRRLYEGGAFTIREYEALVEGIEASSLAQISMSGAVDMKLAQAAFVVLGCKGQEFDERLGRMQCPNDSMFGSLADAVTEQKK